MPGPIPRSYDEITRSTVPEPDSSFRPTVEQERAALAGERHLSADERLLHDAVAKAVRRSGLDVEDVWIEVEGSRVTLRGRVAGAQFLPKLEEVVRGIPDVGDIVDLVVVDSGAR